MGVAKSIQKLTRKMFACTDGVIQMQLTATVVIPVERWTMMTMIIDDSLIHAFEDGLLSLHETTQEAIQNLSDLNIDL
jgi:hypothetical protein